MKTLIRYIKIWSLLAKYEFMYQFSSKFSAVFFFIGKTFRFISFLFILLLLKQNTKSIGGYSLDEVIIFFLTFNLIDITSQMIFRGVYGITGKIRSGQLDFYLAEPINVLFRSLAGSPDFNDLLILIPFLIFAGWYAFTLLPSISILQLLLYLAFLINGFLISMAFHIAVICIGILTVQVDSAILMYRDIASMGRFPVDIYREPLRALITYAIPVGIMMNVPAQILVGKATPILLVVSAGIGMITVLVALQFWKYALRSYTSASS